MRSGLPRLRAAWVAAVLVAAPVLGFTMAQAHDSVTRANESLAQAEDSVRGTLTPSAVSPGGSTVAAGAWRTDTGSAGPDGSAGHGGPAGSAGATEPLGTPRPADGPAAEPAGPGAPHAVVGLVLVGAAAITVAFRGARRQRDTPRDTS